MMAETASRALWQGPRGFSLESISTASFACGRRRAAAASMGSDIPWNAATAEAAADRCRNERREKRGMETSARECISVCASLLTWRGRPRPRLLLLTLLVLSLRAESKQDQKQRP